MNDYSNKLVLVLVIFVLLNNIVDLEFKSRLKFKLGMYLVVLISWVIVNKPLQMDNKYVWQRRNFQVFFNLAFLAAWLSPVVRYNLLPKVLFQWLLHIWLVFDAQSQIVSVLVFVRLMPAQIANKRASRFKRKYILSNTLELSAFERLL